MPFKFAQRLAGGALNKYSGKTDILEAMCAVGAKAANADKNISDEEVGAAMDAVMGIDNLRVAFTATEIEAAMTKQLTRVRTPAGRISLNREIEDCAKMDHQTREDILLVGVNVVASDGNIDDAEAGVIRECAKMLGLDAEKYLAA